MDAALTPSFCCLLITFVNSLDQDQDWHSVSPDLDPKWIQSVWHVDSVSERIFWKEISRWQQKHEKLLSMHKVDILMVCFLKKKNGKKWKKKQQHTNKQQEVTTKAWKLTQHVELTFFSVPEFFLWKKLILKLEDLKVLKRAPDLLNAFQIGQCQLQLIMKHNLFYQKFGVVAIFVKWPKQSNEYIIKQPSDFWKKRCLDRYMAVQMSGLR